MTAALLRSPWRLEGLSAIAYVTELNVGSERGLADGQRAIHRVRRTCIAARNLLRGGAQAQAADNCKKRTMPTQHVCIPQCLVGCPCMTVCISECLLLKPVLDHHFRGRDRDRAIQGSPAFEGIQQLLCLLVVDSAHFKIKANGIEERDVRAHRPGTVHLSQDRDVDLLERDPCRFCQDLAQLYSAAGHS